MADKYEMIERDSGPDNGSYELHSNGTQIALIYCADTVAEQLDRVLNAGCRGGSVSSPKKAEAARRNGKKGGRPWKQTEQKQDDGKR